MEAPATEIFDVVDAQDQVIGQEARAEVHRRGLLHRAVHLFVYNAAGALFLQQRSLLKDSAPGLWSTSCAGHVDAGETYDQAIVREAAEELELRLAGVPERLRYVEAVPETGQEFLWLYRVEAEGPFTWPEDEIIAGRWWSLEELEQALRERPDDFAGSFRYVWELLRGA